jgi:aspartate/methionine/tyrosine aminotransferase
MPRSGIREIFDLAHQIPGAIHLEAGEPSYPTPAHICEAAIAAINEGFTKYTPNSGIPELKNAIANDVSTRCALAVDAEQVVVTPGGVAALFSSLKALTDPGDSVLLSDPAWPNYRMMLAVLGLQVRAFPLSIDDGLVPRADVIERYITANSKVIIVNSPSNPTGTVIPPEALSEIIELARRYGLWVLSDEVYDQLAFDGEVTPSARFDTDSRVITVNSFSKTYAMTGWRVGYAICPHEVAPLMSKVQEPITSCVNGPAQRAALAALLGPQDVVAEMRAGYRHRRDLVVEMLSQGDVPAVRPSGAFYVWADIARTGMSDRDFALKLVRDRHVAVVPGTTFGSEGSTSIRLSLATETELLVEGVRRMVEAVNQWAE